MICSSPRSRIRLSITGTMTIALARCSLEAVERLLGVEPAADDERRAERDADHRLHEAERVEHRHAQLGHLARAERHLAEQAADQRQRARLAARRALRRAGRAAGQDRDPGPSRRASAGALVSAPSISASSVSSPGSVGPGPEAAAGRIVDPLEHVGVLVVVDEQVGALALGHLADLRSGERGVEQDDARAALGGGEHRLEEAAVVAGQDRDALAGLEAALAPGVGERIGALVELPVAQLAALVDQRRAVAVAERAGRDRAAEQAVALERRAAAGRRGGAARVRPARCGCTAPRNTPRRRRARRAWRRLRSDPWGRVRR